MTLYRKMSNIRNVIENMYVPVTCYLPPKNANKRNAFILTVILEFRHIFLYRHILQVKFLFSSDLNLTIISSYRYFNCFDVAYIVQIIVN